MTGTTRRAEELRASLHREWSVRQHQGEADRTAQHHWLLGELENQIDRWLAFVAIGEISFRSLFKDDLFTMIQVATELCSRELAPPPGQPGAEEWQRYLEVLGRLPNSNDRHSTRQLRVALLEFRDALEGRKPDRDGQAASG